MASPRNITSKKKKQLSVEFILLVKGSRLMHFHHCKCEKEKSKVRSGRDENLNIQIPTIQISFSGKTV